MVEVVAGLSVKNLEPRVWSQDSPFYLADLSSVMVSYADFHYLPRQRKRAMDLGLRDYLGFDHHTKIYLDNGAYHLASHGQELSIDGYREFVKASRPDWRPIPRDSIPLPSMSEEEQRRCLVATMDMNIAHASDDSVPILHVGPLLKDYILMIQAYALLCSKPSYAIGGIVPHLLRASRSSPYRDIIDGVRYARRAFVGKYLHLFGLGGTATLHLAALLGIDSTDSSGWRNRAARGIVQLPGIGDRSVIKMGSWRGREPSDDEWEKLRACDCPACRAGSVAALIANGISGFCHRATHNLWVLIEEAKWIGARQADGTYASAYQARVSNSIYRPLIDHLVADLASGSRRI